MPFARFTFQGDCFDDALDRPVQFNANGANVLNIEFAAIKPNAVTVSRELDAVEPVSAFEPGIARLLARFDAPKFREYTGRDHPSSGLEGLRGCHWL